MMRETEYPTLKGLLAAVRKCRACEGQLPLGPRPVLREFVPEYLPLPHPSARNTPWFKRNPWFEHELLPVLRERIDSLQASLRTE